MLSDWCDVPILQLLCTLNSKHLGIEGILLKNLRVPLLGSRRCWEKHTYVEAYAFWWWRSRTKSRAGFADSHWDLQGGCSFPLCSESSFLGLGGMLYSCIECDPFFTVFFFSNTLFFSLSLSALLVLYCRVERILFTAGLFCWDRRLMKAIAACSILKIMLTFWISLLFGKACISQVMNWNNNQSENTDSYLGGQCTAWNM